MLFFVLGISSQDCSLASFNDYENFCGQMGKVRNLLCGNCFEVSYRVLEEGILTRITRYY